MRAAWSIRRLSVGGGVLRVGLKTVVATVSRNLRFLRMCRNEH